MKHSLASFKWNMCAWIKGHGIGQNETKNQLFFNILPFCVCMTTCIHAKFEKKENRKSIQRWSEKTKMKSNNDKFWQCKPNQSCRFNNAHTHMCMHTKRYCYRLIGTSNGNIHLSAKFSVRKKKQNKCSMDPFQCESISWRISCKQFRFFFSFLCYCLFCVHWNSIDSFLKVFSFFSLHSLSLYLLCQRKKKEKKKICTHKFYPFNSLLIWHEMPQILGFTSVKG